MKDYQRVVQREQVERRVKPWLRENFLHRRCELPDLLEQLWPRLA